MSTQQDINDIRAQRFANTHNPLALMANTQTPVHPDHSLLITYIQHLQPNNNFVPQPSLNTNYLQHPMQNLEDILNPTTALDMALKLMAKAFQLNNFTPTNNNQRSSSNPCNSQIAQSGMNIDQDKQMLMVDDNGIQNIRNQNGLSVISGIANQHGNGNVVAARAEGNGNGINGNPIRCYNCQGIAQKEQAGIQLTSEEFDFVAAAGACEETERANANYGSAENDSNVISAVSSMEQGGGTVEQHSTTVEETRAYHESLFHNLAAEVEKVNSVNHKMKETNVDLTTELARYKNQEKCFEISQEKYDKLERCYQKSVYQEKCLTKKVNALHLSSEEKKRLKSDFKIREDELLDKQIQLENKINDIDNILVKTGQSIQTMHMLSPKPDSFYHTEQKMALGYQNPFYLKQAQQKQQSLYNGKVLLENHVGNPIITSLHTMVHKLKKKIEGRYVEF
ncbi:hypothetical protein Tco_0780511 [Tanacetum coccineum]